MKIFLENVNIDSNSGPNHFGKKLKKYLENNNNECVMSAQKCDSHLCFIQSVYQILNTPLILRLDSIYFDPAQDINTLNYLIHHSYKRADGVIFQSDFSKNLVFNYFGECQDYTIIRNGADLELLKEASDFNLAEVSKFEDVWSCAASWYYDPQLRQPRYRKRLSENIRFFLEFSKPKDCLIVAGDVPEWDREKNERIFYVGNLDTGSLFSLYKLSKYFIHLSSFESCPNVVIDARAFGCKIICSSLGGTAEIAGTNSMIVQEDPWDFNPENLQINNHIDFSSICNSEFNSDYDMAKVAKQYEEYMLKFKV